MSFAEKINQLRREKGFSQEQLAEKVNVSRQAVSKWETGEAQPDMSKLLFLCDAFEVSMDELCGRERGAEKRTASNRRTFSWLYVILFAAGLLLGSAGGYFGNIALQETSASQNAVGSDYIFNDLKIADFSFSSVYTGNSSRTFQIVFCPNISNDSLQYQIVCTDNFGNTDVYDAEYNAGVCQCKVKLEYDTGCTLIAAISDGNDKYAAGLVRFDAVGRDFLQYKELWDK
jgi:transcriptional regulator with XRE-family HTH domain